MSRLATYSTLAGLFCLIATQGLAHDVVAYRITDLGDLTSDGRSSLTFTSGINDKGEIVGQSFNDQLQARAFIWKKGRMSDLGAIEGPASGLAAFAINKHAVVVGSTTATGTVAPARAIVWDKKRIVDLGSYQQSGGDTFALDINGNGTIVGAGFNAARELLALRWLRGIPTALGTLADGRVAVQAFGINDHGQVVGYLSAGGAAGFPHAFIWQRGRFTDLGTLPGTDLSFANAVNDEGQVVGQSLDTLVENTSRAFLWENGAMLDLGKAAASHKRSDARAINKKGTVVGTSAGNRAGLAWIWREGVTQNLNTLIALDDPNRSIVRLVAATGINDHDEISVDGYDRRRGSTIVRGYLLTPVDKKKH